MQQVKGSLGGIDMGGGMMIWARILHSIAVSTFRYRH
jgi:hypothetical protein